MNWQIYEMMKIRIVSGCESRCFTGPVKRVSYNVDNAKI